MKIFTMVACNQFIDIKFGGGKYVQIDIIMWSTTVDHLRGLFRPESTLEDLEL